MRSLVKLYEMYKAGEYIKEFSNTKMQYLKTLDEIPEHIRKKLMHLDDKIHSKQELELAVLIILMTFFGAIFGYVLCECIHTIGEAFQMIAQNNTVLP